MLLLVLAAPGATAPMPADSARRLVESPRVLVIGHRGYSQAAPENTLPSFRRALEADADLVELDYHHSHEGQPVVLHDGTLDRTTDATNRWGGRNLAVGSRSLEDLRSLDAGGWFGPTFAGTRLPSLSEALDLIQPKAVTLVERKGGDPATLINLLRARHQLGDVVVQSFDWSFVKGCHDLAPDLVLGALGPPSHWRGRKLAEAERVLTPEFLDAIVDLGARVVVWNQQVTARSVGQAHQRGLRVWVYTINELERARGLIALGIDGLISDNPEQLRQFLVPRTSGQSQAGIPRSIPHTLPDHPGNVFLDGQAVRVGQPQSVARNLTRSRPWRLEDDRALVLRAGSADPQPNSGAAATLDLGPLPVGWYRLVFPDPDGGTTAWTSLAVLPRLRAPIPYDSPVSVDSAAAWFAPDNPPAQAHLANLAALAGINWVRDRLRWRDLQPANGPLVPDPTTYDTSAEAHHRAGLQVLQVFHDAPTWTRESGTPNSQFPEDLRHVHRFARMLAERFHGKVQAWEPWNEANAPSFGGHTLDEMCSWQKAAWLGFKAADPGLIIGWNPTAGVPTPAQTEGVLANATEPYFDTYNIHTYDWAHAYLDLWTPVRRAQGSRPLWITESDRGLKHLNRPPGFDLAPRDEILKAEWLPQAYAASLFAGARQHFHFILGHYHEPNGVQFGLLRLDLTPRPAYVALAAVGRLLAGAQPLGRWQPEPHTHVYAFRGVPDGQPRDVLVAWAEREVDWPERGQTIAPWPFPAALSIDTLFDYLGRELGTPPPAQLGSAPIYVVLPTGAASSLPLLPPPERSAATADSPPTAATPLVIQLKPPEPGRVAVKDVPWSEGQAWGLPRDRPNPLAFHVYNFSSTPIDGRLLADPLPAGWTFTPDRWDFVLPPGERQTLTGVLEVTDERTSPSDLWIKLRARSDRVPPAVLAFRVLLMDP